uniref:Putative alpha-L-fucosidase n=1 Tax=Romanomermis culicivorax TaxID=13658 RepID=A0A915HQG0_ROMCU
MLVFFIFLSLLLFIARSTFNIFAQSYEPIWESLDRRPLPGWYDRAKFGIFVHWGLYSVPSYKSEWFWWYWKGSEKHADFVNFMNDNYKPNFTYADFAPMFTAEFFDPDQWAGIFERSGAKYVVLTSKHHEGFTLWPSKYSWNWNSVDTGPHRDLVGALAKAVRRKNLTFGLYYSQFEWFHPLWNKDAQNNFTTSFYPHSVSVPQMYELVKAYEPEVVWSDGDNGPDSYWQSKEFLAWLYNHSPVRDTVVVNDRWGFGVACKHGGYFTCDDRYSPDKLQSRKWENCMTVQASSWGFDRTAHLNQYLTERDLLLSLVDTVSVKKEVEMNGKSLLERFLGTIP